MGDDVDDVAERPYFTGDVLDVEGKGTVALLQHPCSMRQGATLRPNLLVADVRPWTQGVPSDWEKHPKRMFLPEFGPGEVRSIEFDTVQTVGSDLVEASKRIGVLSQRGVNLLLQRWVHHLTRVVVSTPTLHRAIAAQHEEADLIGEVVGDLVVSGVDRAVASQKVNEWLDVEENGERRRDRFRDPQAHSDLRRGLRHAARTF